MLSICKMERCINGRGKWPASCSKEQHSAVPAEQQNGLFSVAAWLVHAAPPRSRSSVAPCPRRASGTLAVGARDCGEQRWPEEHVREHLSMHAYLQHAAAALPRPSAEPGSAARAHGTAHPKAAKSARARTLLKRSKAPWRWVCSSCCSVLSTASAQCSSEVVCSLSLSHRTHRDQRAATRPPRRQFASNGQAAHRGDAAPHRRRAAGVGADGCG